MTYIILVSLITITLLLNVFGINWITITPPIALALGIVYALIFKVPYPKFNKNMSKYLLQYSVVGLGFGMNLYESLESGSKGMTFTLISVIGTLVIGMLVGHKLLKIDKRTSYLISTGTAICGGSAIAAVSPVIKADDNQTTISLATIFILNAVALFIFPPIGHWLGLTQSQFGLWSAIAIHDTSSVVGAASVYGEEALKIATTVKLTRALWIIPIAIVSMFLFKGDKKKITIPWFILFFVCAILINTFFLKQYPSVGEFISTIAHKSLTLSLFFIGASLSIKGIKEVGIKPIVQGVILWVIISVSTLFYTMYV